MRLARRLMLALVLGTFAVLGIHGYLGLRRDLAQAETDAARAARALGRSLAPAVARAWEIGGSPEALEVVERADRQSPGTRIRWVWPDAPLTHRGDAHEGPSGWISAYAPVRGGAFHVGTIEVSQSFSGARDIARARFFRTILAATVVATLSCLLVMALRAGLTAPTRRLEAGVGAVAHELGTPLHVVKGRAQLIAQGDVQGEEALESARIVVEQAERMTASIKRLLAIARTEGRA